MCCLSLGRAVERGKHGVRSTRQGDMGGFSTWNDILASKATAYVCCGIAGVFFGSNYVVVKQFPVGDGMAFSWFLSLGALLVGYACVPMGGDAYWDYWGMLGGALWAIGNLLVPTVIKFVGMGLGLLLWSIANLLLGWAIGKFGLFGVEKAVPGIEWMNDVGVACGVISLLLFFFINPTIEDSDETQDECHVGDESIGSINITKLVDEEESRYGVSAAPGARSSISHEGMPLKTKSPTKAIDAQESSSTKFRNRMIGTVLALVAGCLYGVNLVPFQRWYDSNLAVSSDNAVSNQNALAFFLCYSSGIFLTTTLAFVLYAAWKRNLPQMYPQTTIPAIISGSMWAIASASWQIANGTLGMTIGYPIVVIIPMLVSSAWGVFVFKEIQGTRNFIILAVALTFNTSCALLVGLSDL